MYALSDEDAVQRLSEKPYWQHFSGERYFRHDLPYDPSSLVRWRQRIGEAGCEWLLAQSIAAATKGRVIKRASLDEVVLDTTVQPKAIAHPTDSRLLNRPREQLVGAAQDAGITLRQSYARVARPPSTRPAATHTPGSTAACSARSGSCAPGWAVSSATCNARGGEITGALKHKVEIAQRLHAQRRASKNKLYSLHAPEADSITKGKVRTPYEFGVKVSVAVTAKEALVVGMRSMPGNPYDGHTVDSQIEILTGVTPKIALMDRGYRGVEPAAPTRLLVSHTRRLPKKLKKLLKRRQVVEPMIGHMKADGLMDSNWLKGAHGVAMHAILYGAGHNLRVILAHLRVLYFALVAQISLLLSITPPPPGSSRRLALI